MIEPGYSTDADGREFDAHVERRPGDRGPLDRSGPSPNPGAVGTGQIAGHRTRRDGGERTEFALEGTG